MDFETMKVLAAALAVAVGLIAPALGEAHIAGKTMEGVSRNPEASGKMFSNMLIAMAFVESLGVYCFLVALILLFVI